MIAAKPDRRMRLLHRLEHHFGPVESKDVALVVDFRLRPQRPDDLDASAKPAHAPFHRDLKIRVVMLPPETNTENCTAVAHVVERRHLVSDMARVMHRKHGYRNTEADSPGYGSRIGKDHAGIEAKHVVQSILRDPKIAEPELFRALGTPLDGRHVDWIGRAVGKRNADGNLVLQGHVAPIKSQSSSASYSHSIVGSLPALRSNANSVTRYGRRDTGDEYG